MTTVLPARITARYAAPEVFLAVDDPAGRIRVRWRMGRAQPWRCDACGPQTWAECCYTFSAGLLLAEELLGLTRPPSSTQQRKKADTMNDDLITQIRTEIPGYLRGRQHLDAVQAELARRAQARAGVNPYKRPGHYELEAMLEAGDPLEEIDQGIAARLAAEQAAAGAHNALTQLRDQLKTEIAAAETSATDVLPLLGKAMAERCVEAEGLAPFAEIASPGTAARSKRYQDADRLAALLDDIVALRREQMRIVWANDFGGAVGKVTIAHAIRNPAEVFDDFAVWLRPGYLVHRREPRRQREVEAPWPWPLSNALTTQEFALWCLQNGAEMWIPSPGQFEAKVRELRELAAQPRTDAARDGDWYDIGPARDSPPRDLSRR